jgi:hypothetical protein
MTQKKTVYPGNGKHEEERRKLMQTKGSRKASAEVK